LVWFERILHVARRTRRKIEGEKSFPFATFAFFARNRPLPVPIMLRCASILTFQFSPVRLKVSPLKLPHCNRELPGLAAEAQRVSDDVSNLIVTINPSGTRILR
jgi:hypothetical protein